MIGFVVGTRPDIVKQSSIIAAAIRLGMPHILIHTGQHWDFEMDGVFFRDFGLPMPHIRCATEGGLFGRRVRAWRQGIKKAHADYGLDALIVYGDTSSALCATQMAKELGIDVIHVEAGLRCHDFLLPEETNRVLIDSMADHYFCPMEYHRNNLNNEGIGEGIHVVGNTVVDALKVTEKLVNGQWDSISSRLDLNGPFIVATIHRVENVDDNKKLLRILDLLSQAASYSGMDVIYPVHPRTRKRIKDMSPHTWSVHIVDPMGYFDYLSLQSRACLVITDSGGIQEETAIMKIPCITVRKSTERQETIDWGGNTLIDVNKITDQEFAELIHEKVSGPGEIQDHEYGENVGEKIIRKLMEIYHG